MPSNYEESHAVDQVAVPVGEWALDVSALPMAEPCVFILTIWVSELGKLDRWEVQSGVLGEDVVAAVFARLNETIMNPARIGSVSVASVQRLELVIERQ